MSRLTQLRPMRIEDIAQVGALYFKIFRNKPENSSSDFNTYFKELFFGSPYYSPENGSFVHETADGQIDSVLSAVPMEYHVNGKAMISRLLGTFMTDPDMSTQGAAQLTLTLRARRQDLCFTNTASPTSASHLRAVGGVVLPTQSLEWCRVFKPAAYAVQCLRPHTSFLHKTAWLPLAKFGDTMIRKIGKIPPLEPPRGVRDEIMEDVAFQELAPSFVADYSVRPAWSKPEISWILHMASMHKSDGQLQIRCVYDDVGRVCGCYVFFGKPGAIAKVLNILATSRQDSDLVVTQMLHRLESAGYVAAQGPVQPRLLEAFSRHSALFYRHKAYTCVSTRHREVIEAIDRHDIFLGGLAGESWSRLASDFY